MTCFYRPHLNHLWSIWYGIFGTLFHAYLLYLGIQRYKLYTELRWSGGPVLGDIHWPKVTYPGLYLTIYIVLHALVIACLPFFIGFSLFKVGNVASDNEKLGARCDKTIVMRGGGCCGRSVKSAWQHGPPPAQTVHLLMSFALLISQQLILAQLHNSRMMKKADVWNTELDFVYRHSSALGRSLPLNATYLKHLPESRAIGVKLLPVLMNQQLFGIPLEFLNYFLALCTYMVVYPSVFWRANKTFAVLFSSHLLVHTFSAIFCYIGFSLLYRIQLVDYQNFLGSVEAPFLLHNHWLLLTVYLLTVVAIYLAPASLYGYGYNKFSSSWVAARNRSLSTINQVQPDAQGRPTTLPKTQATGAVCCEGYGPHVAAIGLLVIMVVLKAPVMYDLMVLYQHQHSPLLLSCIILDVIYLFTWILLWLALTLKRDWDFRATYSVAELVRMLQVDRPVDPKSREDNSQDNDYSSAMLLITGDEVYITDEAAAKASLVKIAQRFGMGPTTEDIYWVKPANPGSPSNRRLLSEKQSPESVRLLSHRRASDDQHQFTSNPVYQQIESPYGSPMGQARTVGSSQRLYHHQQEVSTFGTMPRGDPRMRQYHMQANTGAELHYSSRPPLPVQDMGMQPVQDNYASIHKPRPTPQLMDSNSEYMRLAQSPLTTADTGSIASRGSSYANLNNTMPYAVPQRGPPQARVIAVGTNVNGQSTPRPSNYQSLQYTNGFQSTRAVRQSPVSDRSSVPRQGPEVMPRTVKLSSFIDNKPPTPVPGVSSVEPSLSRETTPSQASTATLTRDQHVHWQANPVYSTVPDTTPNSTLTSQGSYNLQAAPSSPQNGNYASIGKRPGASSFAHHDRNDSANFSWTSSNESAEQQAQLATSIV